MKIDDETAIYHSDMAKLIDSDIIEKERQKDYEISTCLPFRSSVIFRSASTPGLRAPPKNFPDPVIGLQNVVTP